jgi:hypothetical protein
MNKLLEIIREIRSEGGEPAIGLPLPHRSYGLRMHFCVGCTSLIIVAVSLLVLFGPALLRADEKIKIAVEVERESGTGQYTSQVEQAMGEAISELTQYQVVARKDASFLVTAQLASAEEGIVDNVPSADVSFFLRVYEMNPETGKPGLGILVNSTVTKQSVGVPIEKAIHDIVKGATTNALGMLRYRVGLQQLKSLTGKRLIASQRKAVVSK